MTEIIGGLWLSTTVWEKKWGLGYVSRTVQYGLDYVLGLCKCLREICVCKKRVCNNFDKSSTYWRLNTHLTQ